jgi:hypothetical protein
MPPRFSVIIPTRERAETLRFTLRTCLNQDYDDYEILVCDNAGSPATRQVVEEAAAPRLRYVRSDVPLAMSANWELAVERAEGEFLTVLGDDDGLMPYALAEIDRLLRQTGAPAVHWERALYTWPGLAVPGEADVLRLFLAREQRPVAGRGQIAAAARFRACASTLPMVYSAAVRRDVVEQLRSRTGRVFANAYPDVYSGFTCAHQAKWYVTTTVPMSVAGLSGRSNGVAVVVRQGGNAIAEEFFRLSEQAGYAPHPTVPHLPVPPVPVADSFQHAKDRLFPDDAELSLDRRDLALRCAAALPAHLEGEARARALALIRASLADAPGLPEWFDEHGPGVPAAGRRFRARPERMGFDGDTLHLNASAHGVRDVAGAVELAARLLDYRAGAIPYDLPPRHRLHAELNEAPAGLRAG